MPTFVRYEITDRVAGLTIDNPPVNALGPGVRDGIVEASVQDVELVRGDRRVEVECHLRHGLIDPALLKLIGEEEAVRLKAIPLFKVRPDIAHVPSSHAL
jgi:hypothetical protein